MPKLNAESALQYLKGVGPARAKVLAELGLRTVSELLAHFPRDLAEVPARDPIDAVRTRFDQVITVGGILEHCRWRGRWRQNVLSARLADNSGTLNVTFFNAGWLRDKLGEGDRVIMTGRLRRGNRGPELTNPRFTHVDEGGTPAAQPGAKWEPVYPASADITSGQLRAIVQKNLGPLLATVDDYMPPAVARAHKLVSRRLAFGWMHFPSLDPDSIEPDPAGARLVEDVDGEEIVRRLRSARRRLAWEEALLFQLGLAIRRRARRHESPAPPLPLGQRIRERILQRFPFELTAAQTKAVEQIAADLAEPVPMNRLLQGDVGSGKTVVALFAALLAVAHGHQAAIMAPTEILAAQHHERIAKYLAGSRVRWALLTGSLTAARRREVHQQLAAGDLDLVVGTTALLSEGVRFASLAVAVIDEQHRFGVHQRLELRTRGDDAGPGRRGQPHVLVMTATPIPRSLALTVFGDLAVSVIDELPPGRGRIDTRVVTADHRDAAMEFITQRLEAGGQAYIVCPRVGEAETDQPADDAGGEEDKQKEIASAERIFRDLGPVFGRFGMELAHGRMSRDQQAAALEAFSAGRSRVLVATTVIEVGVDVPGANVMAVLGAERFGLAQLHQLRGRIGRSSDVPRSYCLLFTDADEGNALERLRVLEQTRDGFKIAEEDLSRRGPGQFFGTAQHGLPEFRVLDLVADYRLIHAARQSAFEMIAADPKLASPGHAKLRRQLLATHGDSLPLIDAG